MARGKAGRNWTSFGSGTLAGGSRASGSRKCSPGAEKSSESRLVLAWGFPCAGRHRMPVQALAEGCRSLGVSGLGV